MAIRFACPNCNKVFSTGDETAGRRAKCNRCGCSFIIPRPALPVAKPLPPANDPGDRETANLRVLLEAGQQQVAGNLAKNILARDVSNGLAWAAMASVVPSLQEMIKCFEKATEYAPHDELVAAARASAARRCLEAGQEDLAFRNEIGLRDNDRCSQAFVNARVALMLDPNVRDDVTNMVLDLASGFRFYTLDLWRQFLGDELLVEYFEPQPGNPGHIQLKAEYSQALEELEQNEDVVIYVCWEGKWGLIDATVTVTFDGQSTQASFCDGFQIPVETYPGEHTLSVKLGIRGTQTYQLNFPKGGEYRIDLKYSETWGNFKKDCDIYDL
jgi:hypothetical protein